MELPSCSQWDQLSTASWRHNGTKVADMFHDVKRSRFSDRVNLDPVNFSLTLRDLSLGDAGGFTFISEVNDTQMKTVQIRLHVHGKMVSVNSATSYISTASLHH